MKVILSFFVALLGIAACSPAASLNGEQQVKSLEDTIKDAILQAVQSLPDPLVVENKTIQLPENDVVNGQIDIQQLLVQGLTTLQITAINWHTLTLTLDLSVLYDELSGNGAIRDILQIVSSGVSLDDTPSATVDVKGLRADISIDLHLASPIQVQELSLLPSIDSATVELHGVLGDEELSQQLTDEINADGSNWVNENSSNINDVLSPILIQVINEILASDSELSNKIAQLIQA